MSLTAIEEEARSIIKEAEKKAEEILSEAKKDAEELLRRGVSVELPVELTRKLEEEFHSRISELRKLHDIRIKSIKENYLRFKEEIVGEYLRLVLGL
ncbi:MAG: hypothetical protein RMH77_04500 [Sulfolobales archaeon]|nr:hypothetical protein [Sulfolobales archaeon]MCX8185701.1 hypothetical protein [Sulfolobales archaeon]MDW7969644.1 hypothetical protein [Sulfolobales archaeon]